MGGYPVCAPYALALQAMCPWSSYTRWSVLYGTKVLLMAGSYNKIRQLSRVCPKIFLCLADRKESKLGECRRGAGTGPQLLGAAPKSGIECRPTGLGPFREGPTFPPKAMHVQRLADSGRADRTGVSAQGIVTRRAETRFGPLLGGLSQSNSFLVAQNVAP